jgi:DNA-binding NarL/FixJ family response regulator
MTAQPHIAPAGRLAAVVVDAVPMMRAGMRASLEAARIRVAGDTPRLLEGAALTAKRRARVLVVGEPVLAEVAEVARYLEASIDAVAMIVLVSRLTRPAASELLGLGVRGFLPRATSAETLTDAVLRVAAGERVIAPALAWMLHDLEVKAHPQAHDAVAALTRRERDVLVELASGLSNAAIADRLAMSVPTVRTHLNHIYVKLDVTNRLDAVATAFGRGLTHP